MYANANVNLCIPEISTKTTVFANPLLPTTSYTLIGQTTTNTLTNKTIIDPSNNIAAGSLLNGSHITTLGVLAPSTGQVLTATSSTTAGWVTPAADTGVTTMAAIGSSPNANGATISGTTLTLQPANGSFGGVLTTSSQTIGGVKIFNTGLQLGTSTALQYSSGDQLLWSGPFSDTTSMYLGKNSGVSTDNTAHHSVAAGWLAFGSAATSTNCVALGDTALANLTGGANDICIGASAGSAYTSTEANNICIGSQGVIADSGVIRIGTNATHTTCFIQGISGVTSAGAVTAVINSSGQLGTIVSSRKYKNSITPVTQEKLDALMQLQCVSFYLNDDVANEYLQYGFIAEDVEPILPEVIRYEPKKETFMEEAISKERNKMDAAQKVELNKGDPQSIDYAMLWPLLLEQVKILTQQNIAQQAQIDQLLAK